MERIDFIEEILQQAETAENDRLQQLTRVQVDQFLMSVQALENEMEEIDKTANAEVEIIRSWAMKELDRLDLKRQWILRQLQYFLKESGLRSLRSAHGEIRFRKLKDRVQIVSVEQFIPVGQKLGLVRTKSAQVPDLTALLEYVKRTGEILPGTNMVLGEDKFYYSTNGKDHNNEPK
jgi:hypothetical protein